jgi:hypothetical protein
MASEQAIVGISMLALGFLWYSNELVKRGNMLWGQAFQMFSFMFMLVDFTVMVQMFRAESLFDMEDLVFQSLWTIVWYLMWILLGLWFFDMIVKFMLSLRKPKETERIERIGGIEHGAT